MYRLDKILKSKTTYTMINITFPDNSVKQFEKGTTPLQIAESISSRLAQDILAASVNDAQWDITRPIYEDATIKLFKWDDAEGKHAFWHSSAHLLAEALQELYPGVKFGIGPAIETGFYYDIDPNGNTITAAEFPKIEAKMLELAQRKEEIKRADISKEDALKLFGERGEVYKCELINELEDGHITTYTQGSFTDLCRGPHIPNTAPIKAVKIMSLAGAYWRGDEKRDQLVRVYGVSFPKKKMLDEYLQLLEEAKKRDHRKLGKEMELFAFSANVGAGLPLWLPKGAALRDRLEQFLRKIQKQYGYQQVITPHIGNKMLYVTSGHYAKYGKDSFQPIHTPEEGEEYLLKPMNCPHHCEIFKAFPRSYRELPLRLAEFGTVYRYEQSGELHGLTRVRGFTQDDAHIFMRQDQIESEVVELIKFIDRVYAMFGLTYDIELSTRPEEKYIGDLKVWEISEAALAKACEAAGKSYKINPGDGAFYGPKLDFHIKDSLGRVWQCGTIQLDMNLPERFDLTYINENKEKVRPVMLHRVIFGSVERFIGILIEHFGGKFPTWLAPVQVEVLPVNNAYHLEYATKINDELQALGFRSKLDARNEKLGYRLREAQMKKVPIQLVLGDGERDNNTVTIRRQGQKESVTVTFEEFVAMLRKEVEDKVRCDL